MNENDTGRKFPTHHQKMFWYVIVSCFVVLLTMPFCLSRFGLTLLTEILILGLAGMSANLLLGYGGSLPFGHAAFYSAGAYTTAILLKQTALPTVLVFIIAPLVAAVLGTIFGVLIARLYKFYYAMMTTAFSMVLWTLIRKWPSLTGGDDGLTGVEIGGLLANPQNVYLFILIIVLLSIIAMWFIVNSPFGWTLQAIRENSKRVGFIGIDVIWHRYVAFVVSSFFCGIAGVLYVVYSHSTFPDYCYWVKSGDFVTVCILGGMSSFVGPLVGAALLTILQTLITSFTLYWPLVLGIMICVVILFLPDGAVGIWKRIMTLRKTRSLQVNEINP